MISRFAVTLLLAVPGAAIRTAEMSPLATMISGMAEVGTLDVKAMKVDKLVQALEQTAEIMKTQNFAEAAKELNDNAQYLKGCPESTVDECLTSEEHKHTLQTKQKPAALKGQTPAMGMFWSARILGFIGEMFKQVSQSKDLSTAALDAFKMRLTEAWSCSWTAPIDVATRKLVRSSLAGGLPTGEKAKEMIAKLGTTKELSDFAESSLPLADALWSAIKAHQLDGSYGYGCD
mmetsp:Transcript_31464/g.57135  ORF Transcript_31464/g.57135 Transcript_31464/m.57135 type:complete len:233 (+) Transcript_31464:74-772(+)|eukprot:CAMPEP_0197649204 /NCGR_PEP_ID=MMETSP1338-20131121/28215_1 /TAXON_ID=43686 ORGANISM="Pelagodinium beii, Strain RCC1491" /NCGR_SAMPLE_ID=MMETSP1338 /ASSEMBLY_ACC=CAM_ASM_000754 /LENGTH=232 /DNA_ID=CAMNT_0043223339 /DNA_START=56 /DNA_END=754 /DNA_ORIENTATION=-